MQLETPAGPIAPADLQANVDGRECGSFGYDKERETMPSSVQN